MRPLILIFFFGLAASQFPRQQRQNFNPRNFFRPRTQNFNPQFRQFNRAPQQQRQFRQQPQQQRVRSVVDDRFGNSEYHYSWLHAGRNAKWTHSGAAGYCQSLGGGFQAISIDDNGENDKVINVIRSHQIPYIWTSGVRRGRSFVWGNGRAASPPFSFPWSHTGGNNRPQPDNREGGENCLAVLNSVFRDGVTWHDINCNTHPKPVICERKSGRG